MLEEGVGKEELEGGILSELKERTRSLHDRVEGVVDLERALECRERYGGLLARFHGLYRPLEELIEAELGEIGTELDLSRRKKAELLRADLLDLGYSFEAIAELPLHSIEVEAAKGDRVASGLGRLYVLEGATLGGRFLVKEVARRLGLSRERGARFFSSYGDEVGRMWSRFREQLASYVERRPTAREAIVLSAMDTFERFELWLPGGER